MSIVFVMQDQQAMASGFDHPSVKGRITNARLGLPIGTYILVANKDEFECLPTADSRPSTHYSKLFPFWKLKNRTYLPGLSYLPQEADPR